MMLRRAACATRQEERNSCHGIPQPAAGLGQDCGDRARGQRGWGCKRSATSRAVCGVSRLHETSSAAWSPSPSVGLLAPRA